MEVDLNNLSEQELITLKLQLKDKLKGSTKYINKGIYRQKENAVRFFNPDEWEKFIYATNINIRFQYLYLFLTGQRYAEAKQTKVKNIDWNNRWIFLLKGKGNKPRYTHLSSFAIKTIRQYIKDNNLSSEDTFKFKSIQHLDQTMKRIAKEQHLPYHQDFSCHNIRKTHENYLLALNKDQTKVTRHMGHTPKTANDHYIILDKNIKNKKDGTKKKIRNDYILFIT